MPEWIDQRDTWVRNATDEQIIAVAARVAEGAHLDENLGDATERSETLLWLLTHGAQGQEWGHAGVAASEAGVWDEDA